MNLEFYRNFVVLAESYSISDAARKLHIAQPGLSMQLKKMESYYGVQLIKVKQGSRHLQLTDAGTVLYHRLKNILIATDLLRIEVRNTAFREVETIIIGCTPELSSVASGYVGQYLDVGAHVRWRLVVHEAEVLESKLESEEIHCILVSRPPLHSFLYDCQGCFVRPIYVVGRRDAGWLEDSPCISLAVLQGKDICLTEDLEGMFFFACREEGIEASIYMRGTAPEAVVDVAYQKNIPAIVAAELPLWKKSGSGLIAVPLQSAFMKASHCLCTKKGMDIPKVTQKFVDCLQKRSDYQSPQITLTDFE